ncbi:hypothetical protein SCOR_29935 [Sulfidibacter corallicola]
MSLQGLSLKEGHAGALGTQVTDGRDCLVCKNDALTEKSYFYRMVSRAVCE